MRSKYESFLKAMIKNLEVSQKEIFRTQEKLSYHKLVLNSPQKEAFTSNLVFKMNVMFVQNF